MALRDFNSIERALVSFLPSRREIEAAYVFGSVVTGRLRPDSDVDVAVLVSQKVMRRDPFRYRLELMADLTAVLKRDDVDLILLNQAPPLLAHRSPGAFGRSEPVARRAERVLPGGPAAVDGEGDARDQVRPGRGQEDDGVGDGLWCGELVVRRAIQDELQELLVLKDAFREWCAHVCGRHDAHSTMCVTS